VDRDRFHGIPELSERKYTRFHRTVRREMVTERNTSARPGARGRSVPDAYFTRSTPTVS